MTRRPWLLLTLLILPLLLAVWLGHSHFTQQEAARRTALAKAGNESCTSARDHGPRGSSIPRGCAETTDKDAGDSATQSKRVSSEPAPDENFASSKEQPKSENNSPENNPVEKESSPSAENEEKATKPEIRQPTVTISGRVLTHDGRPVPLAKVSVNMMFGGSGGWAHMYGHDTTTDVHGAYTMEPYYSHATKIIVTVYTEFNEDKFNLTGIAVSGKYSGVDLVLMPRGAVKGRVLTLEGDPVVGVKVGSLRAKEEMTEGLGRMANNDSETPAPDGYRLANWGFNNSWHEDYGKTDAKGEYRLTCLSAGEHELRVEGDGKFTALGKTIVVIQAGAEVIAPDIRMSKSSVLRLRPVLNSKAFSYGTATATFYVHGGRKIADASAKISHTGIIEIDAVPPEAEAMWLVVSTMYGHSGHHSTPSVLTLSPGASGTQDLGDVVVEKTPAPVKLKLRVMLDGKPLANEGVKVGYRAIGGWYLGDSPYGSKTDAEGWVEISDVPARVSSIEVSHWRQGITFKADGPIFVSPVPGKTVEVGLVQLK